MTTIQDQSFDFLLGKLDEDARAAIEVQFLSEAASFEQMLVAETELIDDYVSGLLSPDDRERFEERLLINPRQRRRTAFAKTLKNHIARIPRNQPRTLAERISGFIGFRFTLAVGAMVIVAASVWLAPRIVEVRRLTLALNTEQKSPDLAVVPSNRTPKVRIEQPQLNTNGPDRNPSVRRSPVIATFILALGGTRGDTGNKVFELAGNADLVVLKLGHEGAVYRLYVVTIETVEGNRVWSGTRPLRSGSKMGELSVSVPAKFLKSGEYVVSLAGKTGIGGLEPVADYSLTVRRLGHR